MKPDAPPKSPDTFDANATILNATVRTVHHRRKTMSRRTGQDGYVERRNGMSRGRYLVDVPGQFERAGRAGFREGNEQVCGEAKAEGNYCGDGNK